MNLKEIEARINAIKEEMKAEGADLDALTKEVEELIEARKAAIFEERMARLESIAMNGAGVPVVAEEHRELGADSREYRSAFLKNLLDLEMTKEERAAFVHTTANTSAVVPTTMLNEIWDLVSEQHCIMGDITIYRTGTIIEVVKHTAITQGAAAKKNEAVANDDEQNAFAKVTLSGNDFTKHVELSYAMAKMSIEAFESYLKTEIANSIGEAMAADVISTIKDGTAAANKTTTAANNTLTYAEICAAVAGLKRAKAPVVYTNYANLFTYLVPMVDSTGRPLFQPSMRDGIAGTLLGFPIKIDEAVADKDFLIGDPKRVVYNMVQDIMIEQDKDIQKHKYIYAGYARGEGALIDDKSFTVLTVKNS